MTVDPRDMAIDRLHRPLAAVGVAFALLALSAPASQAAQRYASPSSTDTSGSCAEAAPCRIDHAVGAAVSGDEVIVSPGTYAITFPVISSAAISVHGAAGQPRPRLIGGLSLTSPTLSLDGATVSHLYLEANGAQAGALSIEGGIAENLELYSSVTASEGQAISVKLTPGGTLVRNVIARSASPGGQAVSFKGAASPGTAKAVHVTAIGESSTTNAFSGDFTAGSASIVNSIAYSPTAYDVTIEPGTLPITVTGSLYRPEAASGASDGGANIGATPLFVDAAARDYHQLFGSPTIDAGILTPDAGATDIDGDARVSGQPDLGADEYTAATLPPGPAPAGPAPTATGSEAPSTSPTDSTATESDGRDELVAGPAGPVAQVGTTTATLAKEALGGVPVSGDTIGAAPLKGSVLVREPGRKRDTKLKAGRLMPVGTVVDARSGTVSLTTARNSGGALQTGQFWGGRFVVKQSRDGATRLKLVGGSFSGCPTGRKSQRRRSRARSSVAAVSSAKRKRKRSRKRSKRSTVRSLWARDKGGRYSTHGRDAVATVRGTKWLTRDRCDGTLVRVKSGAVAVRSKHTRRVIVVRAGSSRLIPRAKSSGRKWSPSRRA